jgi:hypothetical protein
MTTTQLALNAALLLFVLGTNLGTRVVTARRLVLPLVLVVVAGAAFLRDVPTIGGDLGLEIAGTVTGALLGLAAAYLMRVRRAATGEIVTRAGLAYAALWVAVVGGRVAFAYSAEGWAARPVVEFSVAHRITGADAWTAMFVLMALAMVVTRVAATAWRARRQVLVPVTTAA